MTNSRWVLGPTFGLENLKQEAGAAPPPLAPHQVRVGIRAVSLNFRDLMTVEGSYNPKQPLPLVPCSDASAEVLDIGGAVRRFIVGQRVCPIFAQGWLSGPLNRAVGRTTLGGPLEGVLREEAVFDEQSLVLAPNHLSWEEAATLPCAGVTAWNALFGQARLEPGQRVVVLGTGGVSIFALQFAKMAGLQVAVTSSSDAKLEKARELGADFTVNYRVQADWHKPILEWSRGEGVDKVIEVGGAGTLPLSLRCLRPGGEIAMIGVLSGHQQPLDVRPLLMQQLSIHGVLVGNRDNFEAMNRAILAHQLRPQVDRVFPFAEVSPAFTYFKTGSHFGKVCIQVG